MQIIGRDLIIVGVILILVGLILAGQIKSPLIGRLPGDIYIHNDNFNFYLPLTTSLLISIILTLILNLFNK